MHGLPKSGAKREPGKQLARLKGGLELPDEIVARLIRMFSVKGNTFLDPFLGSGTTTKVAMQTERNSIGYETDESMLPLIREKVVLASTSENCFQDELTIIKRGDQISA